MIFFLSVDYFSGLIKFYLTEKVKREEVWFIVEYLSCVTDPEQITEVLDVLMSLCERASKSKMAKRLSGIHVSRRTVKSCGQVGVSLLRRGLKGFFGWGESAEQWVQAKDTRRTMNLHSPRTADFYNERSNLFERANFNFFNFFIVTHHFQS